MTVSLPSLQPLAAAVLRDRTGVTILASKLWEASPCLVLILRRPGCVLCRAEAKRLWELQPSISALGVNMVCVIHEWKDREVEAYAPAYWPGPLYHDLSKAFYKGLNGGEQVLRGSTLGLLNPFSNVWKRINEARKLVPDHNMVGEGLIMGGLMVVGKGDEGVSYMHVESDLGLHADHAKVMEAVMKVASGSPQSSSSVAASQNQVEGKAMTGASPSTTANCSAHSSISADTSSAQ